MRYPRAPSPRQDDPQLKGTLDCDAGAARTQAEAPDPEPRSPSRLRYVAVRGRPRAAVSRSLDDGDNVRGRYFFSRIAPGRPARPWSMNEQVRGVDQRSHCADAEDRSSSAERMGLSCSESGGCTCIPLVLSTKEVDYVLFERVCGVKPTNGFRWEIVAYCVMPHHWPFVLRPTCRVGRASTATIGGKSGPSADRVLDRSRHRSHARRNSRGPIRQIRPMPASTRLPGSRHRIRELAAPIDLSTRDHWV